MNVNQMVNWLDREEIAAARERRMRRNLRKLPPHLRKFCLSLKRVMLAERGPEIYIRKKCARPIKSVPRPTIRTSKNWKNCCPEGLIVEGVRLK